MSKFSKFFSVVSMVLLSASATVHAAFDLKGGYEGKSKGKSSRTMDLLVSPIEEGSGRYMALLVESGSGFSYAPVAAHAYRLDPVRDGVTFDMTPVQVTPDGTIGVPDIEPSLTLTVGALVAKDITFTIVPQQGGSQAGFQTAMEFKSSSKSQLNWIPLAAGRYKRVGESSQSVTVGAEDSQFRAASDFQLDKTLIGRFVLQQGQERLYSLTGSRRTSTGAEMDQFPQKLGAFFQRKGVTWMMLMNPKAEAGLVLLKRE